MRFVSRKGAETASRCTGACTAVFKVKLCHCTEYLLDLGLMVILGVSLKLIEQKAAAREKELENQQLHAKIAQMELEQEQEKAKQQEEENARLQAKVKELELAQERERVRKLEEENKAMLEKLATLSKPKKASEAFDGFGDAGDDTYGAVTQTAETTCSYVNKTLQPLFHWIWI